MVRISQASQAVNSSGEQLVEITNASVAITSSGTLNVSDSTAQASLSTLSGAVSGTEMQVDIVSAPTLNVSDSTAQASLSSINSTLSSTLTVDGSGSIQPVSGTVMVSSVSGTVATSAPSVSGSNNNHLSSQSVTSAYTSSGFDVSSASRFSIMGNTTDQSNSILVEVSPDNTNWYRINTELYPVWTDNVSPYDFYSSFDGACVSYVRLNFANYTTTQTVNCTILTQ